MVTIFYNNSMARFLYGLLGNKSYAIGPFIFTSLEPGALGRRTLNHLLTHNRQWTELFISVMFIGLFSSGFSLGLFELALLAYYIWYLVEFIIRSIIYKINGIDYNSYGRLRALELMSFEVEAENASRDPHYHEGINLFNWMKYFME